jgi:uncharacterized OsmC-like protein
MSKVSVVSLQAPLRAQYRLSPELARVTDHASTGGTDARDSLHSTVTPMPGCGPAVPVGVHRALGGLHDAPTPGDMLCAALAACQDSAVRMVANILGVELESLTVNVTGDVDVRGTMAMDGQVRVGFQSMRCEVTMRAAEGTSPALLRNLQVAAERCCVVLQTLRAPLSVETTYTVT